MIEVERKYLVKNNSYKMQAQRAGLIVQGDNEGLTIAECELTQATLNPELPDFVGDEVTEDTRYYNYNLASNPYLNWDDDSE